MKILYAWLCFWQKCNSSKYKALKLAKPTHTNKDDQVMHTEMDFNFSLHCLCKNKANSPRVARHISCNIYTAIITHLNMGQMWYKLVETSFHGYSEGICWTSKHYKNQKQRVTLFFIAIISAGHIRKNAVVWTLKYRNFIHLSTFFLHIEPLFIYILWMIY